MEDGKSHELVYNSATLVHGPLHGLPLTAQYPPLSRIDFKRLSARKLNTTYCYDFPLVISLSLSEKLEKENSSIFFEIPIDIYFFAGI
jgi:acetyl-CoA carboxylase / biotin carboxylase 1